MITEWHIHHIPLPWPCPRPRCLPPHWWHLTQGLHHPLVQVTHMGEAGDGAGMDRGEVGRLELRPGLAHCKYWHNSDEWSGGQEMEITSIIHGLFWSIRVSSLFTQIQENNFLFTEDNQCVWLVVALNQQKIYNFRCQLEASMIFLCKWSH